jgi:CubicO group peptidase (beta-lactamase class C family)
VTDFDRNKSAQITSVFTGSSHLLTPRAEANLLSLHHGQERNFMTFRACALLLGIALTGSSLPVETTASAALPAMTPVAITRANDQTRALLKARMAEQHIPALQVAVVVHGRIVMSEAYGVADIEQKIAASRQTLFPLNSATKSFTGVTIMQLVEAGKVDLEAPISRYLDGLPEKWRTIRIRQLLAHSSGLPNIVDESGLIRGASDAEAWAKVQTLPMDGETGTGFAYNQTNYVLLGRLIEKVSGRPFEQFLTERQFTPAALPAARFGDGYDLVPGRADVYIRQHAGRGAGLADKEALYHWIDEIPVSTRAGAGLYLTADDVAQWIIALQGGRLLSPASLARMWQPDVLNDGTANIWAMGWPILAGTKRRAVGGIGGGRSTFFVYPDEGVAVIVMTNLVGANPQNMIDTIAGHYITTASR